RSLLGRGRLEQRPEELGLQIEREQAREDLLGLRLVDEVAEHGLLLRLLLARSEHLLGDRQHILLDHRLDERSSANAWRRIWELNGPASPRSPVSGTIATVCSSRRWRRGRP